MCYVYAADIWCDDCGEAIRDSICYDLADGYNRNGLLDQLDHTNWEGMTFEERRDDIADQLYHGDYDTDEYPYYSRDDYESDTPDHCAAGSSCVNAITLDDGKIIGEYIGNNLTADGVEYVKAAVGPIAELWKSVYYYIDYEEGSNQDTR